MKLSIVPIYLCLAPICRGLPDQCYRPALPVSESTSFPSISQSTSDPRTATNHPAASTPESITSLQNGLFITTIDGSLYLASITTNSDYTMTTTTTVVVQPRSAYHRLPERRDQVRGGGVQ